MDMYNNPGADDGYGGYASPQHTNMLNYLNTNPGMGSSGYGYGSGMGGYGSGMGGYGTGYGAGAGYGSMGYDPYFTNTHTYHKCSPKCSMAPGFCTGRTADDCVRCANHATEDGSGTCVCDPFWSGSDCSVRSTYATCAATCSGCTGPTAGDCV
jgi:hypothetical protein